MELTTALVTHLHPFSNNISLDSNALAASLTAFTVDIEAAVPSYLGLQLTIRQNAHPVTLTRIATHRTATTSLRIPLTVLGPRFDPDSRVTLYAATAGAFVDLAADLSYALHLPTSTDRSTDAGSSNGDDQRHSQVDDDRRITLDVDVPPNPLVSGVSGLSELSTINRAIGVLIDHGHHPDHAGETLRCDASIEGLEPHSYAARLLGRDRARRDAGRHRLQLGVQAAGDHQPSGVFRGGLNDAGPTGSMVATDDNPEPHWPTIRHRSPEAVRFTT